MRKSTIAIASVAAMVLMPGLALSDPDEKSLTINGEISIVTEAQAPVHTENLSTIYSGWRFRSDETQALQMDDFDNPGMIGVENATVDWETVDGSEGKSCATCHGAPEDMAGVRAVYPKWNAKMGKVTTLELEVNNCRETRMGAKKWKYAGGDMTDMVTLISWVSRGLPVNVANDGPAKATWEHGKELYYTRNGQLELSCANCHETNYGRRLRADHLSQGQINGFPTYRLKNTKLNSVHTRFKGCVRETRAQTYKPGSPEFIALELYVATRGNGLSVESPSVRN